MLRKIKRSGAGYVLPAVIVVAVVMLYPLFYTLIMGFFNNTLFMEAPVFCGIYQYKKLFGDKVLSAPLPIRCSGPLEAFSSSLDWALSWRWCFTSPL